MARFAMAGALLAAAASQGGCATIFTGTSDTVLVDCDPPGSTCAVIGGRGIGGLLVTASQANVAMRKILQMIEPHVSPESREKLARVDFNELVAALVAKGRLDRIPPGQIDVAMTIVDTLPIGVVKDIMEMLGIEDVGVTPMDVKLKKGSSWGVLCFKPGYKAKIELVGLRFNAVTILNVLNLFVGCLVDVMTGAMFNLEDRVRIHLKPRP